MQRALVAVVGFALVAIVASRTIDADLKRLLNDVAQLEQHRNQSAAFEEEEVAVHIPGHGNAVELSNLFRSHEDEDNPFTFITRPDRKNPYTCGNSAHGLASNLKDYFNPLVPMCGCLCSGPTCFECPAGFKQFEGDFCAICPDGSIPTSLTKCKKVVSVKATRDIPLPDRGNCKLDSTKKKVICEVKECPLTPQYKAPALLSDTTLVAPPDVLQGLTIEADRKLVLVCRPSPATAAYTVEIIEEPIPGTEEEDGGPKTKQVMRCSWDVPKELTSNVLRTERVCKAGVKVQGEEMCFEPQECPPPPPPLDVSLACGPMLKENMDPMLADLTRRLNALESMPWFKDRDRGYKLKVRSCQFHCMSAARKWKECLQLANWAQTFGDALSGSVAALSEDQRMDGRRVRAISTCSSDGLLSFPLGVFPSDGNEQNRRLRVLSYNVPSNDMNTYLQRNIPLGMARDVDSTLYRAILSDKDETSMYLGSVISARKYLKAHKKHSDTRFGSRNCEYWARMSFKRSGLQDYLDSPDDVEESCLSACNIEFGEAFA